LAYEGDIAGAHFLMLAALHVIENR
jgi:hypothetical protein